MQIRLLITALALALTLSPALSLAQQEIQEMTEGHTEHHPESVQLDQAVPDEPLAEDTATTEETDSEDSTDSMLTFMQQRMDEMISHWDKMSQTDDPAERQQLMLEHRQKMMALNAMMGNMAQQPGMMGPGRGRMGMGGMMGQGGCPMMKGKGPGMGGGMMRHGKHHGMMHSRDSAGMQAAFRQLEKRVDLLQQMVEYMMQD